MPAPPLATLKMPNTPRDSDRSHGNAEQFTHASHHVAWCASGLCLFGNKKHTDRHNITSEHARQILFIANTLRAHAFQLAEVAPFEPAPTGLGAARAAANTLIGVDREVHRGETYLFELLVAWMGVNTARMRAKSVLYPCCC